MNKIKQLICMLIAPILLIAAGVFAVAFGGKSYADGEAVSPQEYSDYYYGSQLTDPVARKLYNAMLDMDMTSGEPVSLTDPDILSSAADYAAGGDTLTRQFDAALCCFYYDHTDRFWVDPKSLALSISGVKGGYAVELGGGRSGNYFVSGVTAAALPSMIEDYNARLDALVQAVKDELAHRNLTESTVETNSWAYWNAFCANDAIVKSVSYSFCKNADGSENEMAPFIRTAYGALVNKQCVCEGYSRLFKAVMDKLGFECVLISGMGTDADGGLEPHMWNAVYDPAREAWYGMDVTWNDVTGNLSGKYIMISGTVLGFDHDPNPACSDMGYELIYPELYKDEYRTDSGELDAYFSLHYFPGLKSQEFGYGKGVDKSVAVSFRGMDHVAAAKVGYYIAYRYIGGIEDPWHSLVSYVKDATFADYVDVSGGYTYFRNVPNQTIGGIEFAVFDIEDDSKTASFMPFNNFYSDLAAKTHIVDRLYATIANPDYDALYVPPAYIKSVVATGTDENGKAFTYKDWQTRKQDIADGKMHIRVEYGQRLAKENESAQVELNWTASLQKLDPRTVDLEEIKQYASVENFEWDGSRVIEFDFTPSPLYQHNNLLYSFTLTNVQTHPENLSEGQLPVAPHGFGTAYAYADTYICTKCLGGGRYLIDNAYSTPVLVSDGDLSTEGWTYEKDGETHKVSESQRSNLALVVTTPVGSVREASEQGAAAQIQKLGLPSGAEVSSATYEVDLNICGRIVSIPDGSYVKINLGFPKGIKYDELDGVVFKLYHFKRVNGELDYTRPEEIECVVTPYGLIATVESFSPYTLVTIKNAPDSLVAKVRAKKGITVTFDGAGGKITSSTGRLTDAVAEGGSITYTFAPDAGFSVEYALLNGRSVAVTNNKITLAYDALDADNVLACGFVSNAVKASERASGLANVGILNIANRQLELMGEQKVETVETNINGEKTVVRATGAIYKKQPAGGKKSSSKTTLIVVISLILIAAVIAVAVITLIKLRRKPQRESAQEIISRGKKRNESAAASKQQNSKADAAKVEKAVQPAKPAPRSAAKPAARSEPKPVERQPVRPTERSATRPAPAQQKVSTERPAAKPAARPTDRPAQKPVERQVVKQERSAPRPTVRPAAKPTDKDKK